MTQASNVTTTTALTRVTFEHLQPVADQLVGELTDKLYLSRESAPTSYHTLANAVTLSLLMTHADTASATEVYLSQARWPKLTNPLLWIIKRLVTDPTYRAAQLAQQKDKLAKCYYTPPCIFLAKPPAWLPASAYLTTRADLDLYPRNGKWWENDHWLTVHDEKLLEMLSNRLDQLLRPRIRIFDQLMELDGSPGSYILLDD